MKRQEIINLLREANNEIALKYKAEIKGIFGSFARGEEGPESDCDILVEFKEEANLLHLVGLSMFLEEKIGVPVDVVPVDAIRREIKENILKEAVYI